MKGYYGSIENITKIKKYIINMLKLYLIWAAIYFPIAVYHYVSTDEEILKSVFLYIKNFVLFGEWHYSWQLWYLLSTIYGALLIYSLFKLKIQEWQIFVVGLFIYVLHLLIIALANTEAQEGVVYYISKVTRFAFLEGKIFSGCYYLIFGMCIAKFAKRTNFVLALLIFILSSVLYVICQMDIFKLLGYVSFFELVRAINLKDRPIWFYLRKSSTVIYFVHMMIFFIYTKIAGEENNYGMTGFIITTVVSVTVSYIYIKFFNKKDSSVIANRKL